MEDKELEEIRKRKLEAMKAKTETPEVIVYSTPGCQYCAMAKEYLNSKGIKFTDYDVSKDRQRAEEMVRATGQGAVPVLQINGRMVVGFDRQLIDDALKKKKPPKRDELLNNLSFDPFNI